MLETLLAGMTDPAALAALGDLRWQASKEQLADALSGRLTDGPKTNDIVAQVCVLHQLFGISVEHNPV